VKLPNKADARTLTLDTNGTSFWVGASVRKVYRFNIRMESGSDDQSNIVSDLSGLCTGVADLAWPSPLLLQTASVNPAAEAAQNSRVQHSSRTKHAIAEPIHGDAHGRTQCVCDCEVVFSGF
jgi:hypothetical protein